jgi:hypothetical protein
MHNGGKAISVSSEFIDIFYNSRYTDKGKLRISKIQI